MIDQPLRGHDLVLPPCLVLRIGQMTAKPSPRMTMDLQVLGQLVTQLPLTRAPTQIA